MEIYCETFKTYQIYNTDTSSGHSSMPEKLFETDKL